MNVDLSGYLILGASLGNVLPWITIMNMQHFLETLTDYDWLDQGPFPQKIFDPQFFLDGLVLPFAPDPDDP